MILTIDIGNTKTKLIVFENTKIIVKQEFATNVSFFVENIKIFNKLKANVCGISSVVPKLTKYWVKFIFKHFKVKPIIINNKIKLPIKLKVKSPTSLGSDRICNAVAAFNFFKRKSNVIVISLGSANTFDVILKNGEYIGGLITPGLHFMSMTLKNNTSLLPEVFVTNKPKSLIGNNTLDNIISGVYYTFIDSINSIIKRIKNDLNLKFNIVITGGNSSLMKKEAKFNAIYINDLVNKGILEILKYNNYC